MVQKHWTYPTLFLICLGLSNFIFSAHCYLINDPLCRASVQLSHGPFTPIVQPSHWSPGCSGSHSSWGWMSQQYRWMWVSSFLEFPVLLTGLQTGHELALVHSPHCITVTVNLGSSPLWIILSPAQLSKTLNPSGLPNLRSPHLSGSRTWIQTQSVPRGASICPWLQFVLLPVCLCHFNYMWRRNSLV